MTETPTIQQALAAVMGDVREVGKKDRNTQQNFSFRGVDSVVNAVAPALRAHGVIVLPNLDSIEYENVIVGKNQTHMIGVRVVVTYVFVGPAGDRLEACVAGEAMDAGDKATAKAMSVAFRIALLQALVLPTDDLDPDAISYERAATSVPVGSSAPSSVSPHASGGPPADGTEDGLDPVSPPGQPTTSAGGHAADGQGEPPVVANTGPGEDPGTSSVTTVELPMLNPDAKATEEQFQNLLHVCGNNKRKAENRLNRWTKQSYSWESAIGEATKRELVAAISGIPVEDVA